MADGPMAPAMPVLPHLMKTRNRIDNLVSEMRSVNRRLHGAHMEAVRPGGEPANQPSARAEVSAVDLIRETEYLLGELEKVTQTVVGGVGLQAHEQPTTIAAQGAQRF